MSGSAEHKLTGKQKVFADLFIGGMAAGPAYVKAGYAPRGADQNASRLIRTDKVCAYIKAVRKALSDAARMEKWEYLDFLASAIEDPLQEMRMKLDAGKQLASLMGWNEPEKHEVQFEVVIGGTQDA